jgi:hypothetical protein
MAAIPALHLCWVLVTGQGHTFQTSGFNEVMDRMSVLVGGFVVAFVFILISATGIRQGLLARDATRRTGEPRLLPNIGLRFSLLALIGWIGVVFIWLRWIEFVTRGW